MKRKSGGGKEIKGMNSNEESFNPKCWRQGGLKQVSSKDVINGSYDSFNLIVLLGRIRTREANFDFLMGTESENRFVIEFTTIITLKKFDVRFKLSLDTSMEVR